MRRMIIQKEFTNGEDIVIESNYDFFDFSYTFDRIGDMIIGNVCFKVNKPNAGSIQAGDNWFKISGLPEAELDGLTFGVAGTLINETSKVTATHSVMFNWYNEGYPVVSGNSVSFNYPGMKYSMHISYKVKKGE